MGTILHEIGHSIGTIVFLMIPISIKIIAANKKFPVSVKKRSSLMSSLFKVSNEDVTASNPIHSVALVVYSNTFRLIFVKIIYKVS